MDACHEFETDCGFINLLLASFLPVSLKYVFRFNFYIEGAGGRNAPREEVGFLLPFRVLMCSPLEDEPIYPTINTGRV